MRDEHRTASVHRGSDPAIGSITPGERLRQGWPYLVLASLITAAILAVLWFAGRALLLLGAAMLVAAILHAASAGLSRLTGIGRRVCLLVVCLLIVAAVVVAAWLAAPSLMSQAREFATTVQNAWTDLVARLREFSLGREALERLQNQQQQGGGMPGTSIVSQVFSAASVTFTSLTEFLLVLILGIYLAVEPGTYLRGLLHLVPPKRRERVRDILLEIAHTLRDWLLGQLVAMTIVGVATTLGLWLLGVPQAVVLGVIAGLLDFIPNLGPILGMIPALLVASSQGLSQAFYVIVLYLAIQAVEGNLIVPLVQRRAVDLPPALVLTAQLVMGLLAGIIGLLLAVPLAAAVMIAVRRAYVEDVLGERID